MLTHTKSVTMWHLIALCNTGLTYSDAEGRYDRATAYLEGLAAGDKNSRTLPKLAPPPPDPVNDDLPFRMGSRLKFNHE
jgi:hypothetical protein